jgi:hypothetical protein
MSGSEIVISVLKTLSTKSPKSTPDVVADMRGQGYSVSVSQMFDVLLKAESSGFVRRIRTDEFDETKPVSTISWLLAESYDPASVSSQVLGSAGQTPAYIEDAKIVVSQPIFLSIQGVDLRSLKMPVLNVREAMEKIVMDARQEIRIACPYYDELFIDVLSIHAQNVASLRSVAVLAETMDPILLKACSLFPNIKVKTLFRSTTGAKNGQGLKIQGVHAKLMIADRSEVLLGSFNFRFSHIYYNVDLGLFAKGAIAEHYARIYDLVWGLKP